MFNKIVYSCSCLSRSLRCFCLFLQVFSHQRSRSGAESVSGEMAGERRRREMVGQRTQGHGEREIPRLPRHEPNERAGEIRVAGERSALQLRGERVRRDLEGKIQILYCSYRSLLLLIAGSRPH